MKFICILNNDVIEECEKVNLASQNQRVTAKVDNHIFKKKISKVEKICVVCIDFGFSGIFPQFQHLGTGFRK